MTLATGNRLGPYEVLARLGAGGMGEVFRARDTRLGRDVAIKLVHPRFAADAEQLRRFEQEARAASQLDHPNILVVHDLGSHEGSPYIVSELLEGESLREKLGTPLPPRNAIEYAVQVAHGLAAAHEKGIVHRDLKPENLFVTRDGRIKILDFGIAKLVQPSIPSVSLTEAATAAPPTEPGVVMGTVAYMSPEQVQGKAVDQRSDLFSLGVILYEMLSGKRPFQKETAVETMTAILREEPPELSDTSRAVSPGLERIVRHCLEKEPSNRFQSARDVAFALESLSQATTAQTAPLRVARGKRRLAAMALAAALFAASAAAFFSWGRTTGRPSVPTFKRVTLRRGLVALAHFTPDYQSVAYCASWEGKPREAFVQRLASADARPLGITDACVMGTAGAEVLAFRGDSTLLRLPLEGGSPRELVNEVWDASWDRSGTRIAVERPIEGGASSRIEFPVGNVVVERTRGELFGKVAVSPDGRQLAFGLRHTPSESDWSGDICVTDESRRRRTVLKGCGNLSNLVWMPDGKEIWFSAPAAGANYELHAVTLSGRERLVARLPGELGIQDIAPDGRVLATFGRGRWELRGRMAGDAAERNLSWTDETAAPLLSPDGTQIVFRELGEGAETGAMAYHWRLSNSTPTRLGDGVPWDASPDWTTVLVGTGLGEKTEAKLVAIGAGETRTLPRGAIRSYVSGSWHPDGKRVLFLGTDAEGKTRLFIQEIAGGLPQPSAETTWFPQLSRDGRFVLSRVKGIFSLQPVDGGDARPLPSIKPGEVPIEFTEDSKGLFLAVSLRFPIRFVRLDLQTGHRDPWLELTPSDLAGAPSGSWVTITPNGRYYAYGYRRNLNDLYVIEGLK
jgi:hypothetical protein